MKKSVFQEILDHFRGFGDTKYMPKINEKASDIICATGEELEKKLSPEQLALHQKFVDALEDGWADDLEYYFAEGVKLGIRLGIECMES